MRSSRLHTISMRRSLLDLMVAIQSVGIGVFALIGNLAESELLLELSSQLAVGSNELLARLDQCLARSDGSVGLDAQQDLGDVRMGD